MRYNDSIIDFWFDLFIFLFFSSKILRLKSLNYILCLSLIIYYKNSLFIKSKKYLFLSDLIFFELLY